MRKLFFLALWALSAPAWTAESGHAPQGIHHLSVVELKRAAAQGDVRAERRLGHVYLGGAGVKANAREAFKWFMRAAEHGDTVSQDVLGLMYATGKGTRKNDREAVKWFTAAARKGRIASQISLGYAYAEGKGVPKNLATAYAWWSVAARQGNAKARRNKNTVAREMSSDELRQAEALAREYDLQYTPATLRAGP